jgi:type VI secretion system protein ImpA
MEALVRNSGFEGLTAGLTIVGGLLDQFWDHLYPPIEDDDLDYRIGPIEFMNDKLWVAVKQIPLTDPAAGNGYSWLDWQDALKIGYESDPADEDKKAIKDELMAAGKPSLNQFESAVTRSSKLFYETLNEHLGVCIGAFARLDKILDERFGREAPRTAEFKQSLEDCERFVSKTLKQKQELEPDPQPVAAAAVDAERHMDVAADDGGLEIVAGDSAGRPTAAVALQGQIVYGLISDTDPHEDAIWQSAVNALKRSGIKKALESLFSAACSVSSNRSKNRYRLLMAKLCLQANRMDLARPIAEELNSLVAELGLERWESPVWIAEVLGVLYRCLITADDDSEDRTRAEEIFKKMCTIDLTKALQHRQT